MSPVPVPDGSAGWAPNPCNCGMLRGCYRDDLSLHRRFGHLSCVNEATRFSGIDARKPVAVTCDLESLDPLAGRLTQCLGTRRTSLTETFSLQVTFSLFPLSMTLSQDIKRNLYSKPGTLSSESAPSRCICIHSQITKPFKRRGFLQACCGMFLFEGQLGSAKTTLLPPRQSHEPCDLDLCPSMPIRLTMPSEISESDDTRSVRSVNLRSTGRCKTFNSTADGYVRPSQTPRQESQVCIRTSSAASKQ